MSTPAGKRGVLLHAFVWYVPKPVLASLRGGCCYFCSLVALRAAGPMLAMQSVLGGGFKTGATAVCTGRRTSVFEVVCVGSPCAAFAGLPAVGISTVWWRWSR